MTYKKAISCFLMLVPLLVILPVTAEGSLPLEKTATIESEQIWYTSTVLNAGVYSLTVEVTSGDGVDVLVLDEENFNTMNDTIINKKTGYNFSSFEHWYDITLYSDIFDVDEDSTTVYILIDNTDFFSDGGDGTGSVDISLKLTVDTVPAPGFELITLVSIPLAGLFYKKRN
ncbi:MAG: hypothetical protein ACFFD4_06815 [Candidatus Odinarchaeota archaeon]